MVVRFNGGAQAGHTVVDPSGKRHVFQHFGAGTFAGVPTYLSEYFVINPIIFTKELEDLAALGVAPVVYAHPKCLVTTFADMWINQQEENKRGSKRHGSVGVGFAETIKRSSVPELAITMGELWNSPKRLPAKLEEICTKYTKFRLGEAIKDPANMIQAFVRGCEVFANQIHPLGIQQCEDPVFEGAQGLLLDQDNKTFFPHVTRSHTGMRNVWALCGLAGITDIEAYYVTRTYLTRHGAGPLPGEESNLSYTDNTNIENPFQGKLRFAPLDSEMFNRCKKDADGADVKLVVTHVDQHTDPICQSANFLAVGPTSDHIEAA